MRAIIPALAVIFIALITSARAAPATPVETLTTESGLTYSVWLPAGFAEHRHDVPLILFSHGFGGCAQQSKTLTQALADAGYAVLAPNHKDKACERYTKGLIGGLFAMIAGDGSDKSFGDDASWDSTTEVSRRNDMEAMLDYALSHAPYRDAIDKDRIAVMGHSLGGYTALGLAGAWSDWRDPRFKAVLALAPFAAPFIDKKTLGQIAVPIMYQAGSDDSDITPTLLAGGGYEMTHAPKSIVVLKDAGHFAWTELNPKYQATIAAYAVAFFDRSLRHQPAPLLDAAPMAQVATYRHTE